MTSPSGASTDIQDLILQLEKLGEQIGKYQLDVDRIFGELRAECNRLLSESKQQLHASIASARGTGHIVLPELEIGDKRLKNAWIALYRYHDGATADVIAADLGRHRTTVSTLLNTLVVMHWATKKRSGHEILYQAVLKRDQGSQ